jgi:hypothetical protein
VRPFGEPNTSLPDRLVVIAHEGPAAAELDHLAASAALAELDEAEHALFGGASSRGASPYN